MRALRETPMQTAERGLGDRAMVALAARGADDIAVAVSALGEQLHASKTLLLCPSGSGCIAV